jgi:sortase (surface protein transpeptidase)
LAVPDDVDVAGWYRFGPVPGDPGSAVLSAHVDSARQGLGAFFPLREVAPGSGVTVTFDDGSARRFEVVARRSYDKDALPLAELFTRNGEPVLTLVTCGGPFDPETGSYEENLVVFAVPAVAT